MPRTPAVARQQQVLTVTVAGASREGARDLRGAFRAAAEAPEEAELTEAVERGPSAAAELLLPAGALAGVAVALLARGARRGANTEAGLVRPALRGPAGAALVRAPIPERAAAWAERRAGALVTEVTAGTQQAVRDFVVRGIEGGLHPRQVAKQVRGVVGLHSRNVPPLERYRAALVKRGLPPERVDALVARRTEKAIKGRCLTIARNETAVAVAEGRKGLWAELARDGHVNSGRMQRRWLTSRDERVDDICDALEGAVAPGLDEPFIGGVEPGEAHLLCRCVAIYEEAR